MSDFDPKDDDKRSKAGKIYYSAPSDLEQVFTRLDERITAVELRLVRIETDRAVNLEKQKFMEGRFNQIDTRLDKIDGHVSRLVWLIIAAILSTFMSFVMRGSLFGV